MTKKRPFTLEFKRGPIKVMIALILVFTLGVLGIKLTHFLHRVSELKSEIHAQHRRMVMEQADCAADYVEFWWEQEGRFSAKLDGDVSAAGDAFARAHPGGSNPGPNPVLGANSPKANAARLIKELVKPYFERLQFAQGKGYLFIITYDGIDVVNCRRAAQTEQSDPNGTADGHEDFIQRVRQAARLPHGAFVKTSDRAEDAPTLAPQIVYARGLEDVGWIIGAGLRLDEDSDNLALAERTLLIRETINQLLVGMVICLLALFLIYRVFHRTQVHLEREFDILHTFFRSAEGHGQRINPEFLQYSEFADLARTVNRMLDARDAADDAFKLEHQRLEALLSVIPARVTFKDRDFRYLTVNRTFCETIDKDMEDIVGKTDFDLFPLDQADTYHADDCLIIYHQEESVVREETLKGASEEEEKWYLSTKVPQRDAGGHICGVVNVVMDISDQKIREQDLFMVNSQLQEAMHKAAEYTEHVETLAEERALQLVHADRLATLGILSAGVAHEINNPIAYVSGNIRNLETFWPSIQEVLVSHPDYEDEGQLGFICSEVPKMCEEMQKGMERIARIVDGLKTYARREPTESHAFDVNLCIENALELCTNRLKYNVTIECHMDRDIPNIEGNDQELEQVFINLFVNAADAIEENTSGELRIKTYHEADWVCVAVEDSGPGLEQDTLDKLFTPFYTTKPPGKGTGLGLAITQSIVENHGGTIKASNRDAGGARFLLQFPANEGQAEAALSSDSSAADTGEA